MLATAMTPADDVKTEKIAPPTPRGQARRARIINTAIRLMWRDGYSAVGIDTILKEAGTQKGSFYHYFTSKSDLLLACLDHLWGVQRQQLQAIREAAPSGRAALTAHLDWFCEAQYSGLRRYGYVPGLFHMAVGVAPAHPDPRLTAKFKAFSDDHEQLLQATLERVAREDGLAGNPETLANLISNYVSGAILKARVNNDISQVTAIPAAVMALIDDFGLAAGR